MPGVAYCDSVARLNRSSRNVARLIGGLLVGIIAGVVQAGTIHQKQFIQVSIGLLAGWFIVAIAQAIQKAFMHDEQDEERTFLSVVRAQKRMIDIVPKCVVNEASKCNDPVEAVRMFEAASKKIGLTAPRRVIDSDFFASFCAGYARSLLQTGNPEAALVQAGKALRARPYCVEAHLVWRSIAKELGLPRRSTPVITDPEIGQRALASVVRALGVLHTAGQPAQLAQSCTYRNPDHPKLVVRGASMYGRGEAMCTDVVFSGLHLLHMQLRWRFADGWRMFLCGCSSTSRLATPLASLNLLKLKKAILSFLCDAAPASAPASARAAYSHLHAHSRALTLTSEPSTQPDFDRARQPLWNLELGCDLNASVIFGGRWTRGALGHEVSEGG
jgi:hypothetical protein